MKHAFRGLLLLVLMASEALPQQNSPQPLPGVAPGEFKFYLAGVRSDGWVGFFTESEGGAFAHRCGDCSFAVSRFGIGGGNTVSGPRIVFKLSQDRTLLTATCESSACTIVVSEETKSGSFPFSTSLRSLKNSETVDISTEARVLFTLKP
jgi:hypothetical protein